MQFFFQYLKQHKKTLVLLVLFAFIYAGIFVLYHLPVQAVLYPTLLCLLIGIGVLLWDYGRAYQKHCILRKLQSFDAGLMELLPASEGVVDEDYRNIILGLCREQEEIAADLENKYTDMMEYYTVWAHQIKTPIAAIRLNLKNEDSEFSRMVAEELQRIEQYVEMVLIFLRLDSESTDYVFERQDLDDIVKMAVKKFSTQFIRRKLTLSYQPLQTTVVTDEKWLSFVIEQVLSNALKYTPSGGVSIYMEGTATLCIKDTGIGIASEDLPRIFEKGYTGYNGRLDKRASGLGLYLCRRICNNLGHAITADSVLDQGTTIRINLEQRKMRLE